MVDWYNQRRPHSTLGNIPPNEHENAHYSELDTPAHPALAPGYNRQTTGDAAESEAGGYRRSRSRKWEDRIHKSLETVFAELHLPDESAHRLDEQQRPPVLKVSSQSRTSSPPNTCGHE